mgnify:CR=1 FL=1
MDLVLLFLYAMILIGAGCLCFEIGKQLKRKIRKAEGTKKQRKDRDITKAHKQLKESFWESKRGGIVIITGGVIYCSILIFFIAYGWISGRSRLPFVSLNDVGNFVVIIIGGLIVGYLFTDM